MSIRILQGDCRQLLATLPAGSVQTCVTSPPYFGQRSYLPAGHPDKALEIGTEATPEEYVAALVEVFRDVRRVLRDDGTLWVNLGDTVRAKQLLGIPWRFAFALQADDWYLRSEIAWVKPSCMPEPVKDRPTSAHEKVFLLAKNASYFYDSDAIAEPAAESTKARASYAVGGTKLAAVRRDGDGRGRSFADYVGGRNCRNVWTIASAPSGIAHHAMMPPELAERCIKAGTSERGQCPHCGSPWERVVERTPDDREAKPYTAEYGFAAGRNDGATRKVRREAGGSLLPVTRITHKGWAQTCSCPEHKPVPQTVLDCFAGAGTTALVADRLGRNAVGCELSAEHAATAKRRIVDDAPLLVAAE